MKKTVITLTVAALAAVATGTGASAGNGTPTCSDIDVLLDKEWKNHGTHVRDQSLSAPPEGPAPGASFCLIQAQSEGLHLELPG